LEIALPYSTVYSWIRELLGKDDTELPDDRLTKWVDSGAARLVAEWPLLPVYADLEASDGPAMDEALGFFVAAKMRVFLMKTEPNGDIIRIHTQNEHFQYANPGVPKKSVEELWIEQAYQALMRVSVIAANLATLRAVPLFQAAGSRRAQEARGVNPHSWNPLWTIMVDEWDYERQHPSFWWYAGWMPGS
jgi:hypothetical protein